MAKKIGIFILILIISIVLASVYGILHNQISYSISPEYFIKFKFKQFGFVEYGLETPRMTAGLIGVWATWWFGLLIGIINGLIGMLQSTAKLMWKSTFGATIRNLGIAFGIGILGVLVGEFIISNLHLTWNFPAEIVDKKSFMTVGTMHEFSYFGGIVGLIYGILFQLRIMRQYSV